MKAGRGQEGLRGIETTDTVRELYDVIRTQVKTQMRARGARRSLSHHRRERPLGNRPLKNMNAKV
jgi:hypothetical protein